MFLPSQYFIGTHGNSTVQSELHPPKQSTPLWRAFRANQVTPEQTITTNNEQLAKKHTHIKIPEALLCSVTQQLMDTPVAIKKNNYEVEFVDQLVITKNNNINPFTNLELTAEEISKEQSVEKLNEINEFKAQHFRSCINMRKMFCL